jgi:ABC-type branched-subunit amino acid transport system substrate-binding protein
MLVTYLTRTLGFRQIGMIYIDNAAFQGSRKILEATAQANGASLVAAAPFPLNATDYSPEIAVVKAAHPDVIYLGHNGGKDLAGLFLQAKQQGITAMLATFSAALDPVFVSAAGNAALNGSYASSPIYWDPDHVKAQADFSARFQKAYGRPGSVYTALEYDAVRGIYAGAVRYLLDNNLPYNGDNLKNAIDTLKIFRGQVTGYCRFAPDRHCLKDMAMYKFANGDYQLIAKVLAPEPGK